MLIHFVRSSGAICKFNQGGLFFTEPPLDAAFAVNPPADDVAHYVVDLASIEFAGDAHYPYCRLIARDPGELAEVARQRRRDELRSLRQRELADTDRFMLPDFPLAAGVRRDWLAYRQGVRELGRFEDPADVVANWPARPDGVDPCAALR